MIFFSPSRKIIEISRRRKKQPKKVKNDPNGVGEAGVIKKMVPGVHNFVAQLDLPLGKPHYLWVRGGGRTRGDKRNWTTREGGGEKV